MNSGERDELLAQLKLIELRDDKHSLPLAIIGKIEKVAFPNNFKSLTIPLITIEQYSNSELEVYAQSLGIKKAGSRLKADTNVNGNNISIKSNKKAPPALVNHTPRPGFEFAGLQSGGDINKLDKLITKYWNLRKAGTIAEDIKNSSSNSPFSNHKDVLKPFLNYFIFDGTGSSISKEPAKYLLSFTNPLDTGSWNIYDKSNALDIYWDKLVFSLRAKKGMPNNYPNVSKKLLPKLPSIKKWTEFIDNDYRGALHIRSTK